MMILKYPGSEPYGEDSLAADIGHLDPWQNRRSLRAQLAVAIGPPIPNRCYGLAEGLSGSPVLDDGPEVVAPRCEQAGVKSAVSRQSRTHAVAAEWLAHRGDEANLPGAV